MKYLYLIILVTASIVFLFPESEIADDSYEITSFQARVDSLNISCAAKIDSFFRIRHKYRMFNGAVLFAQYGQVIYKNAFGMADFRNKDSLSTQSTFQLASLSKPLTAYAILLLKEQGKLFLGDTVQTFFPEFPYKGITIKMLLTHRSGLPNYMYFADKYWRSRRLPISNRDVIDLMVKHQPAVYYLPDYRYNYSNTGYAILASIVEKVSGTTFNDFMEREIFNPLGMKNTVVYDAIKKPDIPNPTIGYTSRGRRAENSYLNGVVGDKGIYSTVEDLFKWDQALYGGILVSDSTLEQAFCPAHKDLRLNDNYGFGWRINASDGENRIVYHTGWWKGYRTYFIRELDQRKTIIVLTNSARRNFMSTRGLIALFN